MLFSTSAGHFGWVPKITNIGIYCLAFTDWIKLEGRRGQAVSYAWEGGRGGYIRVDRI